MILRPMKKVLLFLLFLTACSSAQQQSRSNPQGVNHCRTDGERATCLNDPKGCPCDAYGDCAMSNCLAHGEMVAAERQVTVPVAPPAAPPVQQVVQSGSRICGNDADLRQCSEESYHCPCEAYGDCGKEYCLEPPVKPREVERSCADNQDRADCRRDPSSCPCSVHGLCEMPECSMTKAAPPLRIPPPRPPPNSPPPPPPAQKHPCATAGERSLCQADPWGCPCPAYGDCGMGSCK